MRRKRRQHAAPVSLFSFQDIITCLCGIMILITLLMAISISARNAALAAATPPTDPGLAEHVQTMRQRLLELQIEVDSHIEPALTGDLLQEARDRISRMSTIEELQEVLQRTREELNTLESRRDTDSELLEQAQQEHLILVAETDRLRSEIASAPPSHSISFIPGEDTRLIPFLVETSGKGLRLGVIGTDSPHFIPAAESLRQELEMVVRRYPPKTHYAVFMIKPSGLSLYWRSAAILRALGYEMGHDVIEEQHAVHFGRGADP